MQDDFYSNLSTDEQVLEASDYVVRGLPVPSILKELLGDDLVEELEQVSRSINDNIK